MAAIRRDPLVGAALLRYLVVRIFLPAALVLLAPLASNAQYVYLDTNGDGVNTAADKLQPNGTPTTVDAWIDTSHDMGGAPATCDTGDGTLGNWNSYAINLGTPSGTVTFSNFINRQPSFDLTCVGVEIDFLSNSTEMTACRATPTSEAGGLKKMFTVTVTGTSGTPYLQYLALGNLSPNQTSFGTPCSGNDFDNTYKLGSDFFDSSGAGPAGGVTNGPPQINATAKVIRAEGSAVSVTGSASDPDAADLTTLTQTNNAPFLAGPASAGPSANPSITLTGTPNLTQAGTYTVNWTATDNAVTPHSSTAATTVTIANTNRAPAVTAPATVPGLVNTLMTFAVTASDPDGDAIFSLAGNPLPGGSTFTPNATRTSGTFNWTPNSTQGGSYGVLWAAMDTNGASGTARTSITVSNADRPPAVLAPATASFRFDLPGSVTVSVTDPDGQAITSLTEASSPATTGSTFTPNASNTLGTFNWTPTLAQVGTYTVTFTAANALTGSATTSINVVADRAPVVSAPGNVSGTVGLPISFAVDASDPDGNAITSLTASGSAVTAGASFQANPANTSGTLTWTPGAGQAGSYVAIFTAANALSGSASTSISVGADRSNLVGNPSFETSTVGWGGHSGATIQRVAGGHDGAYSLEVRGPAGTAEEFSVNDTPNWVRYAPAAGTVYRYTAWVRSATSAGRVHLRIRQYVNYVLLETSKSLWVALRPEWQKITVDVPVVIAGATIDMRVRADPVGPGEVFQTDDISIQVISGGSAALDAMDAVMAPNPLNPEAVLAFTTKEAGPIRVHIYTVAGRHVRTLRESASSPGRQAMRFNGMDESGRRLASGIYFYRIEAGSSRTTGRFAIMK